MLALGLQEAGAGGWDGVGGAAVMSRETDGLGQTDGRDREPGPLCL